MLVTRLLRLFWSEGRPNTVARNRSDWRLFGVLIAVVLLEVGLKDDLRLSSVSFLIGLALTPTVLWRRSHPLVMTGIAFTVTGCYEAAGLITDWQMPGLDALAYLLVLAYALFRWGSGREALLGLPIIFASATLGLIRDRLSVGEFLGGFSVMLVPIAVGIAARYRETARVKELEDVRSGERLKLARELHDTVAHHVSAIAVRAQAGIATAAQEPKAAVDALRVIGDEASRTLREMREMVRVLRDDEAMELAPTPKLEDIKDLAGGGPGQARVVMENSEHKFKLSPSLSSAVYRIAQESITNARRHARGANHIHVRIIVDALSVQLSVEDDGEPVTKSANLGGFGLIGMAERVQLFGGTLEAGPGAERGWTVTAILPHNGADATS